MAYSSPFASVGSGGRGLGQSFSAQAAPNPSVKGTSCGKPQAAPYVER